MDTIDDKSSIYNIHLCRICQNPKKLDLVSTSITSESDDGKSCLETLHYIFCEVIWVEDCILSLVCRTCLKRIYETAQFKQLCLESHRKREQFNNKYKELVNEPIINDTVKHSPLETEIQEPTTHIEEFILPCNSEAIFIKTEKIDNVLEDASEEIQQPESSQISIKIPAPSYLNRKRKAENTSFANDDTGATKVKKIGHVPMNEQSGVILEDLLEKAAKATESLLSNKSKEAYNKEYEKFQCWMADNYVEIINETVLLRYFKELSESFSPNSLWTKYSMLKNTLLVNKSLDIGMYLKLGQYLKQGSKGYEAKKSKVLTREEVLKFIHEAPNYTFLMVKVALLVGVFGACRRQELVNMLVDHVEDRGSVVVVNIPETKTMKKRVFTIIEENELGCLKLIREYASLRSQGCSERRFFLNYRNGRCVAQPVGKNAFGKIPSTIATYLSLKDADKYTGHCLRRTSATFLADTGACMATLKRHGGWKTTTVAE